MSFFLDIFNNLIKYNEKEIFITIDTFNNIWFKMKDIFIVLGYNNARKAVQNMKVNENYKTKYKNISLYPSRGTSSYNINKNTIFINESGLYQLLSLSTKPLANKFKDELFTSIMPQIRKNGKYIMDENNKTKLNKINQKLQEIKKDNIDLLNNQRNIIYPKGRALYIIIIIKNNKKYYKIGYTKDLNNRLKVYNTSFR